LQCIGELHTAMNTTAQDPKRKYSFQEVMTSRLFPAYQSHIVSYNTSDEGVIMQFNFQFPKTLEFAISQRLKPSMTIGNKPAGKGRCIRCIITTPEVIPWQTNMPVILQKRFSEQLAELRDIVLNVKLEFMFDEIENNAIYLRKEVPEKMIDSEISL